MLFAIAEVHGPRGTNGVTNGNLLDRRVRQADIAAMTPSSGRVPLRVIFSVATALGFFSAFAAFYFVSTFTDKPAAFGLLLTLNLGYWYSWAVLTPAILWLTRRFPFDRRRGRWRSPVHVAGVVVATSLHVVLTVRPRMATYWVDRRVARHVAPRSAGDAVPEFRLGDDDLLDHRRRRHGAALHARSAREGAERGAARDAPRRGAPAHAAAADAAALPLQHAQHDLGADAPRRRRRGRDDRAAERSAAHVAAARRRAGSAAQGGARLPLQVPGDRTNALPRPSDSGVRRPGGDAARARPQPFAAAARRKRH